MQAGKARTDEEEEEDAREGGAIFLSRKFLVSSIRTRTEMK